VTGAYIRKTHEQNTVTVHIIQALLELRQISRYPLQIIWEGDMVEGMVQWVQTMEKNKIMKWKRWICRHRIKDQNCSGAPYKSCT